MRGVGGGLGGDDASAARKGEGGGSEKANECL
jgi:hypothetical protein